MEREDTYLENLKKEEAELHYKKSQLSKKRKFYDKCHIFTSKDMEAVLKHIIFMISSIEKKEYVDHTFSFTEDDHYETGWRRSPFEGQYGVSGAELAVTAEPYQSLVKGSTFRARIIVDKATCDTFKLLRFSTYRDYRSNLARLLTTTKYFEIKEIDVLTTKYLTMRTVGIKADMFSSMFPYIAEYLEKLTEWRLDNGTEEIPEEVLESIASSIIMETLTKDHEKVAEKKFVGEE